MAPMKSKPTKSTAKTKETGGRKQQKKAKAGKKQGGKAVSRVEKEVQAEEPPALVLSEAEGESSNDEAAEEAKTCARAYCGQFVWPCPREYPSALEVRKAQKWLKPADMGKDEFGLLAKSVFLKLGLGPLLSNLHVFDEPHKRYNKKTGCRERHYHLLFKMKGLFAHARVRKALAEHGVHGHFSFNLVGYIAYLNYCMESSAKKLEADLDKAPWSWPPQTYAALDVFRRTKTAQSAQQDARNGKAGKQGRKRALLTFSEVTDVFVEGNVRSEKEAWTVAKHRKEQGDDTLFNTLGSHASLSDLVAKVQRAWYSERLSGGTLVLTPPYALNTFAAPAAVGPGVVEWMAGGYKGKVLILSGDGGLGKTEFCCAVMKEVVGPFHFLNKLDRLKDVTFAPGQGLLVDELCLADRGIDDVKALLDVEKTRDVHCRNKDGTVPAGVPRIFSTNWPWEEFWPQAAFKRQHTGAIRRRVLWVNVLEPLPLHRRRTETSRAVARPSLPLRGGQDEDEALRALFEEHNM